MRTLAEARDEADQLRAQAREAVEAARAEVHTLAARRDDINTQLGHLSNVIEALAVPERLGGGRNGTSLGSPQDGEHTAYASMPAATTPTPRPLPHAAVDHPADDLTLIEPLP